MRRAAPFSSPGRETNAVKIQGAITLTVSTGNARIAPPETRIMKTKLLLALLLAPALASAQIDWRVSVKFVLDANGNRPTGGSLGTDDEVRTQINNANAIMDGTGRGYRFRITEIVNVSGVSQWFMVDSHDENRKNELENAARNDPGLYAYRNDAINVYINGWGNSAVCTYPGSGTVVFVGQAPFATTLGHEFGHIFALYHTQGRTCAGCGGDGDCTTPGDDEIADTLPELACWDQDMIANNRFQRNYAGLNPSEKIQVDNTYSNLMSYHTCCRSVITSDQLDKMTDVSNSSRNNMASGFTLWVDRNNGCWSPNGSRTCGIFGGPFTRVADAVNSANSGNVILIRPGTYPENITITKRLFLSSTRGPATIGGP